jgi:endonuclease/exonuclease/phosphatase family metal-dependent hydrolase
VKRTFLRAFVRIGLLLQEVDRAASDWLFVKGAARNTGRVERVEDASDHYPLVATVVP